MQPISEQSSVVERAADQIRAEILTGTLEPGERLVQTRVAAALRISRGPVREAFKLLRAEGLLVEEHLRGTHVIDLSARDVREIYDLRAGLESRAAKLLAGRLDERRTATLRRLVARIEQAAAAHDIPRMSQFDLEFHTAVVRMTGNNRLFQAYRRDVPLLRTLISFDERVYVSLTEIVREHPPLIDALATPDGAAAAALFEAHVERARDLVAGYIGSLGASS